LDKEAGSKADEKILPEKCHARGLEICAIVCRAIFDKMRSIASAREKVNFRKDEAGDDGDGHDRDTRSACFRPTAGLTLRNIQKHATHLADNRG